MSKSNTTWSADGKTILTIEPHTKTKHLLTEQYVIDYIYTLYGQPFPRGINTFTFIDGFCGGGIYHDPESNDKWYGSPIRLINAVKEGYLKSQPRHHSLDVKFIFIDSKKAHLNCLKNFVFPEAGFGQLLDEEKHIIERFQEENLTVECEFICDEFENRVDYCCSVAKNRKGNSLFFLDPFGWSDVSMNSFRKINSLKNSEIIYTFMIDYIYRFIDGISWTGREAFNKILEADGYFDINELRNLDKFGEQAFYRNELMRLLRDRGNAKKIITFAMMSKYEHRVEYYLVHICHHLRALEVMREGSWKFNNLDYQYHYEIYGYGFNSASYYQENQLDLKFDISQDSDLLCINKLNNNIFNIVNNNPKGFTFKQLCEINIEVNPGMREHYYESLKILREDKVITVKRNGKITKSFQLQNNDIIERVEQKLIFPTFNFRKNF